LFYMLHGFGLSDERLRTAAASHLKEPPSQKSAVAKSSSSKVWV